MEEENKKDEIRNEEPKQKSNKVFVIIIIIIAMALTFGCGIILGQKLFEGNKENKNTAKEDKNIVVDNNDKKEENNTSEPKQEIPIMDSFIFDHGDLYLINNGNVYVYDVIDEDETKKWGYDVYSLTHSGCLYDNSDEYCKGNPSYSNKATKIDGLENVIKLKLYNRPYASDESFAVYAITEEGNIYTINNDKVTKFLGNNDIEDMLGQNGYSYEILLKNGKHMIYRWTCIYSDGDCDNMENTYVYEEKK